MVKRTQIDWEGIEREFRAGQLSVAEIGRQYSISHTAINKKAKKEGWKRDLANKVRERIKEKLVADVVSKVSAPNASATETETIEAAAERGADVVRLHRKDIHHGRRMAGLLMGQLEEFAGKRSDIEDTICAETADDSNNKRRNQMLKAVSLPAHAGTLRDLATAMKNFIALERQAFNLDVDEPPEKPMTQEQRLARIAELQRKLNESDL